MARAYSDDLRNKLLSAHAAGKGTLRELAGQFGVSVAWAWKIAAAHKKSGAMERKPQSRHGRSSRVDRNQVKKLLQAKPDMVLRELQSELASTGVGISQPQLWRVLRELGFRLKKSRSMPPNATPKRTAHGVKSSSSASARSRRNA
jgi:transposase